METEKASYALRPDAQAFDEVRIKVEPRFKESELSGSEWRISASIELYRKGKLIVSDGVSDMQNACGFLYAKYMTAIDNGNAYFAGNGKDCDQEGCNEPAKFILKIKQGYSNGVKSDSYTGSLRCFCAKHKHRGDQCLEDCDSNYELIKEI